jgi:hypothetical protein
MIVEKDSFFHSLCHTVIISSSFVIHERACIVSFLPKLCLPNHLHLYKCFLGPNNSNP